MVALRMKDKDVLSLAIACMMVFSACVDNKYDLADVDTDTIVIGDEIVTPLGSGTISVDRFLDFDKIGNALKTDAAGNLYASYTGNLDVENMKDYLPNLPNLFNLRTEGTKAAGFGERLAYDVVDLSDLSSSFSSEGLVLSLKGMHFILKTETDVAGSIPSLMELVPYKDDAPFEAIEILFDVIGKTNYWIGADVKAVPEGYSFKENTSLNKLLTMAPSRLDLNLYMDFSNLKSIEIPVNPYANLAYEVNIPLIPAVDFKAVVNESIEDAFDASFVDYFFSGGSVDIYGDVTNGIPLNLDMKLIITDSNNRPVGIEIKAQTVSPCGADGKAATSKVTYTIEPKDMEKMKAAANIRIELTASGDEATGNVGLRKDQKIELALKLKKTGGIHI